ncbi:hypothetical protein D9M73_285280 [compost metagenome]
MKSMPDSNRMPESGAATYQALRRVFCPRGLRATPNNNKRPLASEDKMMVRYSTRASVIKPPE